MRFDDHHDISDPSPPHADGFRSFRLRAVLNEIRLILGVTALGALGIYAANTLPYLNFTNWDKAYRLLQACVFVGYGMLAFSAVASCRVADRLTRRFPLGWRVAIGGIAMAVATGIAFAFLVLPMFLFFTGVTWHNPQPMWVLTGMLATVLYASLLTHRTGKARRAQVLRLQLDAKAMKTTLDQAELSMLEAQIAPHFLFNTLSHIKRHCRINPAGSSMLAALSHYLNHALPALRCADWTLGDELTLIRTYLDILIERFQTQLRFVVAASEESRRVRLPALMVATLVENAVVHGIAPQVEGGTIWITAEVDSATLRIEVKDDGVGFIAMKAAQGNGLGIATERARLLNAFGARADLTLKQSTAKGTRATITIPLSV